MEANNDEKDTLARKLARGAVFGFGVVCLLALSFQAFGPGLNSLVRGATSTTGVLDVVSGEPLEIPPRLSVVSEAQKTHVAAFEKAIREKVLASAGMEGNSGDFPLKTEAYRAMSILFRPKVICEIGFNLGHSSIAWLEFNPKARLISFDLGEHNYAHWAAKRLSSVYGARFEITFGSSVDTLPSYFAKHPEVQCDIAHVDGGHSYEIARTDLKNFAPHITPGKALMIDDVNCAADWCLGPVKAWKEFITEQIRTGRFEPLHIEHVESTISGFGAAVRTV